jgi:hypothetical protein
MGTYVGAVSGTTSSAGGYLSSGWSTLSSRADTAFNAAMNLAQQNVGGLPFNLKVPTPPTIDTAVSISTSGEPSPPTLSALSLSLPDAPTLLSASYSPGTAPTFVSAAPSINYPSVPTPTSPDDPGSAPAVSTPVMPADPSVYLPSVPSLRALSLPDAPSVYLTAFSGVSPSNDLPELVQPNFIWQEAAYTERLPQLSSKIAQYLSFDFDAAETAIWERGQDRVDRATNTAVNALSNDFASRGFALPTGVMLAAVNEARMKGAEAKYDNARDAMIKAAELNTQKLTVAIQSGIQYEGMWMNYQTEYAKRAFDAAKVMVDVALKLFDAKVALFNARLAAYQAEAQVHRDTIQAELTKIEVYKAELEGQKIIGELNMQDVELYKAQLSGALAAVEVYKAQVSAVIATIEVDKARLQGYETSVQAYKAKIEANTAEYQSWGEVMRGEAVKGQLYETEVRAFAARVDAYKSQESVGVESAKLQISNNEMLIKSFVAELSKADAYVKAFSAEVDAQSRMYATQGQVYGAVIGGREAEARVKVAAEGLKVEAYKAEASISIEEARTFIASYAAEVQAFVGRMQAAGGIISQLGASAMSAFNLSAGVSEGFSLGVSNTLSESYTASV